MSLRAATLQWTVTLSWGAHCAGIVLAAHGPYTAAGVSAVTDLSVDVIGTAFGSFHGVVSALEAHFTPPSHESKMPPPAPPPPTAASPPVKPAGPEVAPARGSTEAPQERQAQRLSGMDHLQLLTPQ